MLFACCSSFADSHREPPVLSPTPTWTYRLCKSLRPSETAVHSRRASSCVWWPRRPAINRKVEYCRYCQPLKHRSYNLCNASLAVYQLSTKHLPRSRHTCEELASDPCTHPRSISATVATELGLLPRSAIPLSTLNRTVPLWTA